MGFSDKAKAYFYDDLGLDHREISKKMEHYNESLISRYINSDKVSATFVLKIKKYFPQAPIEDWMIEDEINIDGETAIEYKVNPIKKINKLIKELEDLKTYFKEEMSQK